MKKLIYAAVAALTLLTASCNLERIPDGFKPQKPYENMAELKTGRKGVYVYLRAAESMSNVALSDYQTDLYNITNIDAGKDIGIFSWDRPRMLGDDGIAGYYASYYTLIMQANYFEMRAEEALANKKAVLKDKGDDIALAEQYIAEARVMRAVAIYRLMMRFGKGTYNPATAANELGVCLVKQFDQKPKSYPRSSKKECYDYALEQLNLALGKLSDGMNPKDFAPYTNGNVRVSQVITKDYAYALMARIYLQMQEWQKASDAVGKFISNYSFVDIQNMAQADQAKAIGSTYTTGSSENMVRLFASKDHGSFKDFLSGGTWSGATLYYRPSFIPQQWVVDLYTGADVRARAYLAKRSYDGGSEVVMVSKFQGDPAFNTNPARHSFLNAINLFNIAEAYLIRAEANVQLNNYGQAEQDLRALSSARGLSDVSLDSPEAILDVLRKERVRELIGEGVRLNDLHRWNMPMERSAPQPAAVREAIGSRAQDLKVPVGDQRFSWEFPLRDRQVNNYLKGNTNWGM